MKRSTDRMLTTHVGSLPRPYALQQLLQRKDRGEPYDAQEFERLVRDAIRDAVRRQVEVGIDIISDGEMSKTSFTNYVRQRLTGLEGVANAPFPGPPDDFPEFAAVIARYGGTGVGGAGLGGGTPVIPGSVAPGAATTTAGRPLNTGPLAWKNKGELETDITNLLEATRGVRAAEVFMPAVAVGQVRFMIDSTYYCSERDYLYALADVLREEYEAIVHAGFVLQVDSPDVPMMRNRQLWDVPWAEYRRHLGLRIEALNHALAHIPEDRIRFHVCWGNTYGPHHRDVPLKEIVDLVLRVKAQAYSIEAANPRHAHEWEIWQDVQLPDGKILIPGVIDSVSLFIETPELVCQRLVQYAELVGRENVIAAPDCGFGTFSAWAPRVHSEPLWEKFRAMVRGAELATQKLWGT
jgi:5-methyltetrahydropteroyltriglutamate--homocysteine methyltransferase